jgi:hypothetical protein
MTSRSAPLFILMGKKSEKSVKEKIRALSQKYFWFRFLPSETRTKHLAHSKRNLGGSDPVSTFGRQNRTNTGVAPAQIEVFVRGLFAERISAVHSSMEPCGGAQVNGTPLFMGEQCVCSCVHPCWLIAEREEYLSTRTLPSFQCSAAPERQDLRPFSPKKQYGESSAYLRYWER